MAAWIFAEKFFYLVNEKNLAFNKLHGAYKELESANALKELGESTAIISHQIKNQMCQVSYWTQRLGQNEPLTDKGKERLGLLNDVIAKIITFSTSILDMSKSHIIQETNRVDLCALLKKCISSHFPDQAEAFKLEGMDEACMLHLQWEKLEQAFVNICSNSFDAAGKEPVSITIRVVQGEFVVLLIVEDNGTGCTQEEEKEIFKAFYTTKKSSNGTGLGLSMARTIIESHGGKIAAYSKNLEGKGQTGLKLIMTFPQYDAEGVVHGVNEDIVLVKEGLPEVDAILRIFNNVGIRPFIVQEPQEALHSNIAGKLKTLFITPANYSKIQNELPDISLFMVSQANNRIYILADRGQPEVLSEEYLLSWVIRTHPPKADAF